MGGAVWRAAGCPPRIHCIEWGPLSSQDFYHPPRPSAGMGGGYQHSALDQKSKGNGTPLIVRRPIRRAMCPLKLANVRF